MADAPPVQLDVVEKSIGQYGKWQFALTFYIFLSKFSVAQHQICIIFLTPPMKFTCASGEVEDPCNKSCTSYKFDRSIFDETITSQWDLVCDKEWLNSFVQMITMFGILIGNICAGFFSDRFGRKYPLATCILLQSVAGTLCAFSPWFPLFVILKFISTVGTGGQMVCSFVILMEWLGRKRRTVVGALYQLPFNIGHLSLPGISYLLRDWRYYQVAFSVSTIPLITYYCFLPESPRWLMTHQKSEKAIAVLQKVAKFNKMPVDDIEKDVNAFVQNLSTQGEKPKIGIVALFKSKVMCIYSICIFYNWFVCGFCYFGVSQYVGNLGGNIFMNIAISAAITIPGTLFVVYSAGAWGRKITTLFMNICAAIPLLIIAVVPDEPTWIKPMLAAASMFGLFGLFCIVYIYAGEVFPTVARNVGIGLASLIARIGSMISPYVQQLNSTATWIPSIIFGVIPLLGFVATLFLPETANTKLPDSIEETEEFHKNRKGVFK